MATRKYALIEKKGAIANVIINDPDKRNRLSPEVIEDLISAYEEVRDDDSVLVVITTGAGDVAWCAGLSGQMLISGQQARLTGGKSPIRMTPLCELVRNFPKVTIAAVGGYCLGGGITLLTTHDLAMASEEKARFGLPEVKRGFPPKTLFPSLFRAVPLKWAFDMMLTGDNWDARTAQKAGLITRIVPQDQLKERAFEWANEIARWDPITLQYCKKAAQAGLDERVYVKGLELTGMICDEHARVNRRSQEGMHNFLAKTGVKATQDIKWV